MPYFCPRYDKQCPESNECHQWDVASSSCAEVRRTVLLGQIKTASANTIKSPPAGDEKKITSLTYNLTAKKITVKYKET